MVGAALTAPVEKSLNTEEHQVLADLLRDLRTEAGLTQVELAARLDRPQSLVSGYESGQRRVDVVELRSIAHALGTTLPTVIERFERAVLE